MPRNYFDQACRYLAKLDPAAFLCWLLGWPLTDLLFRAWLDTRRIPFPGEADRTCDTVAHIEDVASGQEPWALVVEFQLEPDPLFFGRGMIYGGQLWLEIKPSAERGDRFNIGIVVVNLTGRGKSGRTIKLRNTRLLTAMQPEELDLCDENAQATLDGIAAGTIPDVVLPLIPVMTGGGDPATIEQWLTLAALQPDARRRADYGSLVLIFAEAAGCRPAWKQALRGWGMRQSEQVLEWQAEGRAEALVDLLELRFGPVPDETATVIRATIDVPHKAVDGRRNHRCQSGRLPSHRRNVMDTGSPRRGYATIRASSRMAGRGESRSAPGSSGTEVRPGARRDSKRHPGLH